MNRNNDEDQKDEGAIASKRQEAARNVVAKYGDEVREDDKKFAEMIDTELDEMQGDNDYAKGTGEVPDHLQQPGVDEDDINTDEPNTTPYPGTPASTSGPAKASTAKKQGHNAATSSGPAK